uniref:Polynucleotide adenylyltransferase family protein n=1 Tax=Rhizophora mucronata TaxID=61149 RepID=A0A2P2LQY4_RHIMU
MLTMGLYVPIILAARILRAVRIAARLGFRFSKETAHSVKNFSKLILRLDKVSKHPFVTPFEFEVALYIPN